MREPPDIPQARIVACLRDRYGLAAAEVEFLPLGADQNTAVYRVIAGDRLPYFFKLRRGDFDSICVELPHWLHACGVRHIIAPVATREGRLWANLDDRACILYPFVEGRDGYDVPLLDGQWVDFGIAIKSIHTAPVPEEFVRRLPRERYTPRWRETVKTLQSRVQETGFDDPVAAKCAAFFKTRGDEITFLVRRAGELARDLSARAREFVLCHSDLHAGNLLMAADDRFYIVDWDDPILAPKERDLMFVGGGQGFAGRTAREEETLFYQGYGPVEIDPVALAYYRYERIVQDIAVIGEQLLTTDAGGQDREIMLGWLADSFLPNHAVDMACRSENVRPAAA